MGKIKPRKVKQQQKKGEVKNEIIQKDKLSKFPKPKKQKESQRKNSASLTIQLVIFSFIALLLGIIIVLVSDLVEPNSPATIAPNFRVVSNGRHSDFTPKREEKSLHEDYVTDPEFSRSPAPLKSSPKNKIVDHVAVNQESKENFQDKSKLHNTDEKTKSFEEKHKISETSSRDATASVDIELASRLEVDEKLNIHQNDVEHNQLFSQSETFEIEASKTHIHKSDDALHPKDIEKQNQTGETFQGNSKMQELADATDNMFHFQETHNKVDEVINVKEDEEEASDTLELQLEEEAFDTSDLQLEETEELSDTSKVQLEEVEELSDTSKVQLEEEAFDTSDLQLEETEEAFDTIKLQLEEVEELSDTSKVQLEEEAFDASDLQLEEAKEVTDTNELQLEAEEASDPIELHKVEAEEVSDIYELQKEDAIEVHDASELLLGEEEVFDPSELQLEETEEVPDTSKLQKNETEEAPDTIKLHTEEEAAAATSKLNSQKVSHEENDTFEDETSDESQIRSEERNLLKLPKEESEITLDDETRKLNTEETSDASKINTKKSVELNPDVERDKDAIQIAVDEDAAMARDFNSNEAITDATDTIPDEGANDVTNRDSSSLMEETKEVLKAPNSFMDKDDEVDQVIRTTEIDKAFPGEEELSNNQTTVNDALTSDKNLSDAYNHTNDNNTETYTSKDKYSSSSNQEDLLVQQSKRTTEPENIDIIYDQLQEYDEDIDEDVAKEDTYSHIVQIENEEQSYHVEEKRTKIIRESQYVTIKDGVKKHVLREGYGSTPEKGDTVTLQCMGFIDQIPPKMFWNTKELGQKPFKFILGERQVIKGWDQAVESMKLMERSKFKIEAKMAYGKYGFSAWNIPPNADLIMEFQLIEINRSKRKFRRLAPKF